MYVPTRCYARRLSSFRRARERVPFVFVRSLSLCVESSGARRFFVEEIEYVLYYKDNGRSSIYKK